jgi:drug/metabolite transporter (DMT)-like permease
MPPSHKAPSRSSRGWLAPAGVVLLSLLWVLGPLRATVFPSLVPDAMPQFEQQAIPLAIVAVAAAGWAVFRRERAPDRASLFRFILVGLGLFAAPALLDFAASGFMSDLARTALFALTPVFTLVFEPYFSDADMREPSATQGRIPAALAALAGALLVFPIALPESLPPGLAFAAVAAASACVAVGNCAGVVSASFATSLALMTAVACGSAAAVLSAASYVFESPVFTRHALAPDLFWAVVVEAPALAVLFWLMPRMSAARMATRFLFAPALAVVAGSLLLRSPLVPRTWLGLALMAGGAAWLLLPRTVADDVAPGSFNLR